MCEFMHARTVYADENGMQTRTVHVDEVISHFFEADDAIQSPMLTHSIAIVVLATVSIIISNPLIDLNKNEVIYRICFPLIYFLRTFYYDLWIIDTRNARFAGAATVIILATTIPYLVAIRMAAKFSIFDVILETIYLAFIASRVYFNAPLPFTASGAFMAVRAILFIIVLSNMLHVSRFGELNNAEYTFIAWSAVIFHRGVAYVWDDSWYRFAAASIFALTTVPATCTFTYYATTRQFYGIWVAAALANRIAFYMYVVVEITIANRRQRPMSERLLTTMA